MSDTPISPALPDPVKPAAPTAVRYVTYDAAGNLDGCYLQVPTSDHAGRMIIISDALALDWVHYRANAAHDGVELVPPAAAVPANRDQLKQARQAAVDAITVTVGTKVFDGDEISQGRMARALRVSEITGQTSCTWVLHDNTAVTVTSQELGQALALAMQAQGQVWVIPS